MGHHRELRHEAEKTAFPQPTPQSPGPHKQAGEVQGGNECGWHRTPCLTAHSLPVGQQPYERVSEELHSGFGGEQQADLHVLIQQVFLFPGTVGGGSRRVGHHALCGDDLAQLLPVKAFCGVPCDHGRVVIVGEDTLEAS